MSSQPRKLSRRLNLLAGRNGLSHPARRLDSLSLNPCLKPSPLLSVLLVPRCEMSGLSR